MLKRGTLLPLLAIAAALAAQAAEPPPPLADDPCAGQVLSARKEGAAVVTPMLKQCLDEKSRLMADAAGCDTSGAKETLAELTEGIRRLAAAHTGSLPPAEGFDPLAAIEPIAVALRKPAEPVKTPADPAELKTIAAEVERLESQVASLSAANADLQAKLDATPKPSSETRPPITAERLRELARAFLPAGECDEIDVSISDTGALKLTGTAASAKARDALREHFAPFEKALAEAHFEVAVSPGGKCNKPLGGGWSIRPAADGRIARIPYSSEIESIRDFLPTVEDCNEISFHVAQHPVLGPDFAPDLTPRVWCRQARELGICMRDTYSTEWTFRPDRGRHYTAFAVFRVIESEAQPR